MTMTTTPAPQMHVVRQGAGRPLLMLHGLGGSWRSWQTIMEPLAAQRQVIAVDLPGHGDTPPLAGETSVPTLADCVVDFLDREGLRGVDVVGSSMGARLVLELARRGVTGAAVSLNPGGFWEGWHKPYFHTTLGASIRLIRLLQPVMPALTGSALGRTLLFPQLSARPWKLPAAATLDEMRSFASTPVFDELLRSLVRGPEQQGAGPGASGPITIGWGRQDRVCLPSQSRKALRLFPSARLHWFDACGHFPHWDQPGETVRLILDATDRP
jgi:pimeloyl-ACP methyl ester carboxylesterase